MDKTIIHVTERSAFRRCRWSWGWEYVNYLKPKKVSPSLWLGEGIHIALAEYYKEGISPVNTFNNWAKVQLINYEAAHGMLWTEELTMLDNQRDLGLSMVAGYLDFAEEYDNFEVVEVEKTYTAPIPSSNGGILQGTIDLLVRIDGQLWVIDHKTSSNKALTPDELRFDDQLTAYAWLVSKNLDEPLAGVIHNTLRKKLPVVPKVLKTGGLSKDKQIDTTYGIYMTELVNRGFRPCDYEEILEILVAKGNTFFTRTSSVRTMDELSVFEECLAGEYYDMGFGGMYPNLNSHRCSWDCDYQSLCLAKRTKDDYPALVNAQYEVVSPNLIAKSIAS